MPVIITSPVEDGYYSYDSGTVAIPVLTGDEYLPLGGMTKTSCGTMNLHVLATTGEQFAATVQWSAQFNTAQITVTTQSGSTDVFSHIGLRENDVTNKLDMFLRSGGDRTIEQLHGHAVITRQNVNDVPVWSDLPLSEVGAIFTETTITKSTSSGNPLGTIISSLLSSQDMAILDPTMQYCDGTSIVGSALNLLNGTTNAPNLIGQFIRGAGGGRVVDTFQGDATARPNTNFTTNNVGNHFHSIQLEAPSGVGDGNDSGTRSGSGGNILSKNTTTQGAHTHSITGGGDGETRPQNYSVHFYIKIN